MLRSTSSDRARFVRRLAAATAFMAFVLLTDASTLHVQLGLGIATALFVLYLTRTSLVEGRQIVCAVLVATTGEIVLSLGWGLYTYKHALIPFYVPPGHGLFYLLAAESARQEWIRPHAKWINRSVVIAGSAIAVISLIGFGDTWGFLWWLAALALLHFSRDQLLLSACFSYTIVLEWAGTAIGNWRWMPVVPGIGLHSANPPAGVGLLYILLDLIVIAITTRLPARLQTAEAIMASLSEDDTAAAA